MTLSPLGDSALVLTLGEEVDDAMSARVAGVAEAIRRAAVAGVVDVVPAFATVTVFYDVSRTGAYSGFEARVVAIANEAGDTTSRSPIGRTVEIPVCYGGEYGPDLETVAAHAGAGLDELIEMHSGAEYRVHAIGFVPGFGYLGGLPHKLHAPRRATPRPSVAVGSVGIGGSQTGVYPMVTPGGWNLIGRTPLVMFDATRNQPALLHTGDRVRFRAISSEEFVAWKSA
jgi:inhibitor of KinA